MKFASKMGVLLAFVIGGATASFVGRAVKVRNDHGKYGGAVGLLKKVKMIGRNEMWTVKFHKARKTITFQKADLEVLALPPPPQSKPTQVTPKPPAFQNNSSCSPPPQRPRLTITKKNTPPPLPAAIRRSSAGSGTAAGQSTSPPTFMASPPPMRKRSSAHESQSVPKEGEQSRKSSTVLENETTKCKKCGKAATKELDSLKVASMGLSANQTRGLKTLSYLCKGCHKDISKESWKGRLYGDLRVTEVHSCGNKLRNQREESICSKSATKKLDEDAYRKLLPNGKMPATYLCTECCESKKSTKRFYRNIAIGKGEGHTNTAVAAPTKNTPRSVMRRLMGI